MDSYEKILAVGGKSNSLGRAGEVVGDVNANPARLDELFACIWSDDAWVRMRAIDSFEKIVKEKSERVWPYLGRIFDELTKSEQPSIQWHLAQIFSEVQLTDDQRGRAIKWLKDRLKTTDVDWIVAVNVMKALVYFYQGGYVAGSDLKLLFKVQEGHTSKTVRKKAKDFQQQL